MSELPRIVIVGAGLAGMCAAERLRELGFDGEIVIIGSESTMPVYRPALTKQFLTGELGLKEILTAPTHDLDAVWRLNTVVSQLDAKKRVVHLPGGEQLEYDGLIIASGVEARSLPGAMRAGSRVAVLRSISDSKRLRQALTGARAPIAVIGTGFIGCEVASSIRSLGQNVVLIGQSKLLMNNLLDPGHAQRLTELHRRNRVQLQLGTKVEEWGASSSRVQLRLSNGRQLDAAFVVVAAGSVPAVSWLRDSGATLDNGVVCDPTCHVAGMEDVVAAGDVASWPNLRFDTKPRRVEHWTNAIEMGRASAENLLTGRESAVPFMPVPRFWSEQHGLRLQAAGMPAVGTEREPIDPTTPGGHSLTGYYRDKKLVGVIGFDNSAAVLHYAKSFVDKAPVGGRVRTESAGEPEDKFKNGQSGPTRASSVPEFLQV
ncbi:FAD/NAD(P)-binding oxidoreductase [Amycolatopsis oliviviridis]|uniref:Ferredoxin reductase n=1 Tax=Amycolatopsis oliviviridis TaxID=1471590 RepID=A0ABQ3LXC7_9PSEU|nr:FAD/NAD(P)-binding oxidoreductase [Amycolatopsis oliviviridis]GHH28479.1 ferredoxin reductase [Amycolatopsis oliviviridis]